MNTRPTSLKFLPKLSFLMTALLCTNMAHAAKLVLTGLEENEELEENVLLVAGDIPKDERLIDLYIELLPDQTRKALAAYGYFEPEIDVQKSVEDEETVITLKVLEGSPVKITSITVDVTGPGATDRIFLDAQRKVPLKEGEVFISDDYESAKSILLSAAQAKGYFDFEFITSTVLVSRTNRTAIINLVASSGPRFTFGNLKFDQTVFSENFLSRWAPFTPEDPYDASQLAELNDNLRASGYFESVVVAPQRDVRYGPTVPVLVSLKRQDFNQIGLGFGYSAGQNIDPGFRGKLTWARPLINAAGHSANAEINLAQTSQAVTLAYRIPRRNQPLHNYWGIEYGLQNTSDDTGNSFLSKLQFERVRKFKSDWRESIFLRWERENYTIAGVDDDTDLILPGIAYTRTRTKGFPFLTWGQTSSFELLYGSRKVLSTIDFAKAEIYFKYLRAFSKRHTAILAMRFGAISSNDFERLPSSQRFFAGGDRSIRGYSFKEVSPTDADGTPVGGRYLEAGTAELNYRFRDRWSFAVFADVGRAFNEFGDSREVGAGAGIRWQSPVGPFRLDLAIPVGGSSFRDIKLHLSLGPEL